MSTAAQPVPSPADSRPPRILVVDDERSMRELLAIVLRREGYEVLLAENGRAAIALLEREPVDLLISDIKMPDLSGVDVLRAAKKIDRDILGIMITAFASTDTAVEAMRLGACDYISKPFDVDLLKMKVREKIENRQLKQENLLLKRTLGLSHQFANIIGRSEGDAGGLQDGRDRRPHQQHDPADGRIGHRQGSGGAGRSLQLAAPREADGRRSTAARCRRPCSSRSSSVTCAAPYTSADSNKKGLLEVAEKGTIFLDEIGEMSAVMQVKLLRVLQERRFRRVGGLEELTADIRVIAATNQDLTRLIAEGRFREDLFYRINVIPISLPPLRERREDIPLLADHFLAKYAEQMDKAITGISRDALELLVQYDWPGNIRELENVLERAVALEATPTVLPDSLPGNIRGDRARGSAQPPAEGLPDVRLRPRSARQRDRARLHRGGAEAGRWRPGEGRRTAGHELPVVPLLRQEIQPAIAKDRVRRPAIASPTSAITTRSR